jgi:hypothetical protein
MSKDMEKHIGDIASTRVKNILYCIFFEPMVVGKHGMDIGGCWKGPKTWLLSNKGHPKGHHGC